MSDGRALVGTKFDSVRDDMSDGRALVGSAVEAADGRGGTLGGGPHTLPPSGGLDVSSGGASSSAGGVCGRTSGCSMALRSAAGRPLILRSWDRQKLAGDGALLVHSEGPLEPKLL